MKKKHVVEYGEIDIHEGTTSFWFGFALLVLVAIGIAKVFM